MALRGMGRPLNLLIAAGITLLFCISAVHWMIRPSYSTYIPTFSPATVNNVSYPRLPVEYRSHFPSQELPSALLDHPILYSKLYQFLVRPVYSHEEGLEWNEASCPRETSDALVNKDQLENEGSFWREQVDKDVVREKRADMVKHLAKLATKGLLTYDAADADDTEFTARRRGIVTTAGNADTTARLLTLLRVLRKDYEVRLPVEVWTFPGELVHGSQQYVEIEQLGGTIHVVPEEYHLVKDTGAWKNFQIKGLAIALSKYQELLYLDSDNIPLRDPTYLFDTHSYTKEGSGKAVFWPDLSRDHVDNAVWRIMGTPCTMDDFTFESGQIVIDKTGNDGLNLAALHLAAYMQIENQFWFKLCGGDKDTFRWAFVALDIPFTRSSKWITCLGKMYRKEFCGHTVLQYELDPPPGETRPRPLFMHSNLLKHISGVREGSTFTHLRRMSMDDYTDPSLNQAHMWVYWGNGRGMCTDIELRNNGDDLEVQGQYIMTQALDEVEGQPFYGFEEMFFKEGGRAGGW